MMLKINEYLPKQNWICILAASLIIIISLLFSGCDEDNNNGQPDEPKPVLTSISPTEKLAHCNQFTLTANGENFKDSSRIVFNGVEKGTTFIDTTMLTCEIMPEDITAALEESTAGGRSSYQADKQVPVLVRNRYNSTTSESQSLYFTIRCNYSYENPQSISDVDSNWSSEILLDKDGNLYVLWTGSTPSQIYLSRTDKSRINWSSATKIYQSPLRSSGLSASIDKIGNLNVVWQEEIDNYIQHIYFTRSTDGGSSWSNPKRISSTTEAWEPTILSVTSKNLLAVFEQWNPGSGSFDTFFTKSENGGKDWSKPVNLSNDKTTWSYLTTGGSLSYFNDNIYAVWHGESEEENKIFFSRSNDDGITWGTPKLISSLSKSILQAEYSDRISSRYLLFRKLKGFELSYQPSYPSIHTDSTGRIYVFWMDTKDEQSSEQEIWFSVSEDTGNTWSDRSVLSKEDDLKNSYWPDIALDNLGNINAVYYDKSSGIRDIIFRRSYNNGGTWSQPINISNSNAQSRMPHITIDENSNVYIIWSDNRGQEDKYEIYFTKNQY